MRISGYSRNSGSGSDDPYKRGTETFQFSVMAAGLYRILFYRCAMAGFNKEELIKAIEKYNQRDRRYGGVKEE